MKMSDQTKGILFSGETYPLNHKILYTINGMLYFFPISDTSLIGKTLKYGFGNVSP